MAACRPKKLESNTGMDLISQLPVDLKQRILECLDTGDAVKTAMLSTHWNDVWLHHGRLVFDSDFFQYYRYNPVLSIINNTLSRRAGPVKKFTLDYNGILDPPLGQSDIDRWCLFLSRNGIEELDISLYNIDQKIKLPDCIFWCPTIKQLKLVGFLLCLPVNAGCIFPGITSLVFRGVEFKCSVNGIAPRIPNLEKLAFGRYCHRIDEFEISAPKLEILCATCFMRGLGLVELRWFPFHLKTIKTLCLSGYSLLCKDVAAAVSMFPTATNLQVMKLYDFSFYCWKEFTVAMKLLQKSPNLCELDIMARKSLWSNDTVDVSRLLKDPNACFISQDLKMLNTVKIGSFSGSALEVLFVKMLLSTSPVLERLVIHESKDTDASMVVKVQRKLLRFPRASPNAQIVFTEWHPCCYQEYGAVLDP